MVAISPSVYSRAIAGRVVSSIASFGIVAIHSPRSWRLISSARISG
jgi:hypothetical protein